MKPLRPLLFLLSLGLFAMQFGGYGRRYSYQSGPNVPSEFYWTRLQYTSANGGNGFRFFGGGWSGIIPRPTTIA